MKKCELIQSDKGMKNGLHPMMDFSSYPNMVKPAKNCRVNPPIGCRVNQNQKIMLNIEHGISNNEFSISSNSILIS